MLARLVGMVLGVRLMAMRDMGMVARLFFIPGSVMLSSGAMMFRGMLVMFSSFQVVVLPFFRHRSLFLRLRISA
jgi:hypothetical protein